MPKPYYDHKGITIYHGDCRDILPHLDPVDLVLTDPPYGMGKFQYDVLDFGWMNVLKTCDDSSLYMFIGDNSYCTGRSALERHFIFHRTIIWEKENVYGGGDYLLAHEYILYGKKGNPVFINTGRIATSQALKSLKKEIAKDNSVWKSRGFNNTCKEYVGHPTQKPIQIIRKIISNHNGTILDPFMGSGTTLVAAKQLGRKAIGIEIEEKYVKIAIDRLSQEVLPL